MTSDLLWQQLETLLSEREQQRAAVLETFPQNRAWSYFEALDRLSPAQAEELRTAGRRLVSASRLAQCPILAVAGKLNAGKTSLVASFLSPAGRLRALRGEANHQGTHRFALWLPERWRADAELFGNICARIGDALGAPPEELSLDPATAHAQYNNRHGATHELNIPLLATDAGLDEVGIGFLDCPDTDTSEALELGSPEQRLELLRRAAPLCSGFLVVVAHHALRDARLDHVLKTLCEAMPHVERMLAVNMVRPRYAPQEVLSDMQELIRRHTLRQVYLAYDYDIPDSAQYRPASSWRGGTDSFPEFFIPVADATKNQAAVIPDERWLHTLPSRLDPADLFRQLAIDLKQDVARKALAGVDQLKKKSQERQHDAVELRQKFLEAVLQVCVAKWSFDQRIVELRLLQNPAIAQQLMATFVQAAPWYARLQLKLQQGVRLVTDNVSAVAKLVRRGAIGSTMEDVRGRLRSGSAGRILSAESLAETLVQVGAVGPRRSVALNESELLRRCEVVVTRLEQEMSTLLDQGALDQAAREVWRNIPPGRKLISGLTALGGAVAAFGAVLLIPFDGGGTAVLAAASVKELLGAAGIAGAAAWLSGQQFQKAVAGATALQQVADFVAALCDTFGIPRQSKHLPPLQIPLSSGNQLLPTSSLREKISLEGELSQFELRPHLTDQIQKWTVA